MKSDRYSTKRKSGTESVVFTEKCTSETTVIFTENRRKKEYEFGRGETQ